MGLQARSRPFTFASAVGDSEQATNGSYLDNRRERSIGKTGHSIAEQSKDRAVDALVICAASALDLDGAGSGSLAFR